MPAWNTFTKQERADLVALIKHFSPRWQNEKPGTPITIPAEPEITPERIKAGQEVFKKMECWKCHGVQGMANGPSASTLTDDLGRPILPFNFTEGSRPLCGSTDHDIYKIFMTGLDGTPMPSFSDNIKPDEAWDLVFYLRTLQPSNSFNAKERQIANQLGLKPVDTTAPAHDLEDNRAEFIRISRTRRKAMKHQRTRRVGRDLSQSCVGRSRVVSNQPQGKCRR